MNEGIKVYVRIAYSLFAILKDKILSEKDPSYMKSTIRKYSLEMNEDTVQFMIRVNLIYLKFLLIL